MIPPDDEAAKQLGGDPSHFRTYFALGDLLICCVFRVTK